MAIAPLFDIEGYEDLGSVRDSREEPWPRAGLRAVPDVPGRAQRRRSDEGVRSASLGHREADAVARRDRRTRIRRRRRGILLAAALAALVTGLAVPVRALGGVPASPPHVPQAARLAGATAYVVQPGDTLWSIAERFDRGGDPRPMAEAIARETGSETVVPGERIFIP